MKTKAELLGEIARAWDSFQAVLAKYSESQLTTSRDAVGWTAKDHISHLAVWERRVLFVLQGKPVHEGLGVDEELYRSATVDELNALIQPQHAAKPLAEVLGDLRQAHQSLVEAIQTLSDEDLHRPYRQFVPYEIAEDDDRTVLTLIAGNTTEHFPEHLGWIDALIAGGR
jgi:hypothetical protein